MHKQDRTRRLWSRSRGRGRGGYTSVPRDLIDATLPVQLMSLNMVPSHSHSHSYTQSNTAADRSCVFVRSRTSPVPEWWHHSVAQSDIRRMTGSERWLEAKATGQRSGGTGGGALRPCWRVHLMLFTVRCKKNPTMTGCGVDKKKKTLNTWRRRKVESLGFNPLDTWTEPGCWSVEDCEVSIWCHAGV